MLLLFCALLLLEPAPLKTLRDMGDDSLQGLAPVDRAARADVAAVVIGEQSLLRYGPWPWSRDRIAHVLDLIAASGARAAALNIILDTRDRFSPARLSDAKGAGAGRLGDTDEMLAEAMRALPTALASSVGAGFPLDPLDPMHALPVVGQPPQSDIAFAAATRPLSRLRAAAVSVGAANLVADRDMVLRRAPAVVISADERAHPALAVAALEAGGATASLETGGAMRLRLDGRLIPLDRWGLLWLDFARHDEIPRIEASALADAPDPRLAGKIAVVGVEAVGHGGQWRAADGRLVTGTMLTALTVDALQTGAALWRPDWIRAAEACWFLVGAAALSWAWTRAGPRLALAASLGLIALTVALAALIRLRLGVVTDWLGLSTLLVLMAAVAAAGRALSLFQAREALMQALRARMATAEEAEKAKSDFLAAISHDLRGPLNAILGFSDLMGRMVGQEGAEDKLRDYAQSIHRSGHHMLMLANRAVRAAELGSDAAELELQDAEAQEMLMEARRLALAAAQKPDVSVTIAAAARLRLRVDRTYFMEALTNLLANAIAYGAGPDGIRLSWGRSSAGEAVIEIADSGPGLSKELLAAAGTRFLSRKMGRRKGGFGLGLHLAKHAVALHDGRLELENRDQGGLSARIVLPAKLVIEDGHF